jgi:hypothetical protein
MFQPISWESPSTTLLDIPRYACSNSLDALFPSYLEKRFVSHPYLVHVYIYQYAGQQACKILSSTPPEYYSYGHDVYATNCFDDGRRLYGVVLRVSRM